MVTDPSVTDWWVSACAKIKPLFTSFICERTPEQRTWKFLTNCRASRSSLPHPFLLLSVSFLAGFRHSLIFFYWHKIALFYLFVLFLRRRFISKIHCFTSSWLAPFFGFPPPFIALVSPAYLSLVPSFSPGTWLFSSGFPTPSLFSHKLPPSFPLQIFVLNWGSHIVRATFPLVNRLAKLSQPLTVYKQN